MESKDTIQKLHHHERPVAEQIHRLFQASYRVEAEILGVAAEDFPPLRRTLAEVQASGRTFYGYVKEGEIAGVVEVEPGSDAERDLSIASLVVDPGFFKAGIGEALVRFALSLASGTVQVATGAKNGPALALYAKLGFKRREVYVRPGGIPVVELERRGRMQQFPRGFVPNLH